MVSCAVPTLKFPFTVSDRPHTARHEPLVLLGPAPFQSITSGVQSYVCSRWSMQAVLRHPLRLRASCRCGAELLMLRKVLSI